MTLNITVATEHRIYQSADYQLTDLVTGKKYDDARNQKIFVSRGNMWLATVCFNGVGRTAKIEVSSWLSEVCNATTREESLDDFLRRLQSADTWLLSAPPRDRRHSFIVAAFVGRAPTISLVSNYERFDSRPAPVAASRLTIHQWRFDRPRTFVSGQPQEISRPRCRALARLASETKDPEKVFIALAKANQDVAEHNDFVSSSCFTTYVRRTGEGAGRPHEMIIPAELGRALSTGGLETFLRSHAPEFDFRGRTLKQFAFAHFWATDEYHAIQLEDKPDIPDTHSNYGAYLLDTKGDIEGAERAYRKALAIDPAHANALGNLAIVMDRQGRAEDADALYRKALTHAPGQENASYNYATFLRHQGKDAAHVRGILEGGIRMTPESGRLHLRLGEIELLDGRPGPALAAYRRARELGAEQVAVEVGYAFALHSSGAPTAECIAAYRTAIALNPTDGALRLNMAQLLFAAGLDEQARSMLRQAWEFGLDPPSQLEAYFYSIAHTRAEVGPSISAIRRLLEAGARIDWNMAITLERVRSRDPIRATVLTELCEVLTGSAPLTKLSQLAEQLSGDIPSGK